MDTTSLQSLDYSLQRMDKEANNLSQILNSSFEEAQLRAIFGEKNAREMQLAMEFLRDEENSEKCLSEIAFENGGTDLFSPKITESHTSSVHDSPNPHEGVLEQSFLVDLAVQRTQKMAEIADELPHIDSFPHEHKDANNAYSPWSAAIVKFSKIIFQVLSDLVCSLVCRNLREALQKDLEATLVPWSSAIIMYFKLLLQSICNLIIFLLLPVSMKRK
eukprot:CAMPEP_0178926692 /NCGR_PEP_ID=MMETSP0786-20121207/18694_1 /TAXON_ID=186022 /ORGANISM="Thalassionema frauenfeldii, Strain CCMP 1798" /LENGTH=217 /DNA_ID=CAMNT_0020601883 /DNA_START=278 /DNA_END=931 /DNA_ORIENTATION=-